MQLQEIDSNVLIMRIGEEEQFYQSPSSEETKSWLEAWEISSEFRKKYKIVHK